MKSWMGKKVLEFSKVKSKKHGGQYSCIGTLNHFGNKFTAFSELLVGGKYNLCVS